MKQGEVRIIAGLWRSRKLKFPTLEGLRPTPNRVRETLFNWLAPIIKGTNCLDLFAGSGALGIEALSRGAQHVVFVDQQAKIIQYLQKQLQQLNANNTTLCHSKIPIDNFREKYIQNNSNITKKQFDIIFLDPPFQKDLIKPVCHWLTQQQLLAENALIYIEVESQLPTLPIPASWEILRNKKAGEVSYYLIKYQN